MRTPSLRPVLIGLCTAFVLFGTGGCGSMSSVFPTDTKVVPKDTLVVTSEDGTELRPEVARLYALEARLLEASDSVRTARLLNRAMTELASFLRDEPHAMEKDAVRKLYDGLTMEYRRFHGYGRDPDSLEMARGSIFSVRARLFASLNEMDPSLVDTDAAAGTAEMEGMSVPVPSNRFVDQSIEHLQKESGRHVDRWLRRVQVYGPMINHILAEEEVPQELKYLAMVESGLNPRARSWAGAVGMWQFMPATGRRYGLEINAWVDERRDPEKATRAAARHLRDLYEDLDSWPLAMAAYNCGANCVRRALRRTDAESPTYWDVYEYLPRETRGYVPMFIAAVRIMNDPGAYDIESAPPTSAFSYDYVAVHGSMMSLSTVARLAGTERSVIRSLNPELRRSRVPPSKSRYHLRIPLGSYPRFVWNYADLPDRQKQPATTYTVRAGDTLSEIAVQYGTSTDVLRSLNDIDGTIIRKGEQLVVPVREYDSALATANAADDQPMRVQYGTSPPAQPLEPIDTSLDEASAEASANGNADASSSSLAAVASGEGTGEVSSYYRVQRGDTLGGIAQRFGVSVRQIRAWNDMEGSRIMPGQRLRISD